MFSYWLTKWRFLRAFEPDGQNFLYRRNRRSAPVFVTAAERIGFVKNFRRLYWKQVAYLWGGIFIWIGCLVAAAIIFDLSEAIVSIFTYASVFGLFIVILLNQRRIFDDPQRQLAGRAPVALPRTSREVLIERVSKLSWTSLTIRGIILLTLAGVTFPHSGAPIWWPFAWTGYFGLCFFLLARNGWTKAKLKPENAG